MEYTNLETGKKSNVPWYKEESIALGIGRYSNDSTCETCGIYPVSRYVEDDSCVQCAIREFRETWNLWKIGMPGKPDPFPKNVTEAVRDGVDYFYRDVPCKGGPHLVRPHIKTGRCLDCEKLRKPTRVGYNTTRFMEDNPNMVIDKQTASVLNLIVYRTGLPCRRGHKFWRYVDGGACIACMRPNTYKPEIKLIEQPPYVVKLNEQPSLFVGYAYDKKRIIGPDGRKLNELQFNSLFEETAFELKDGKVVHSAFKAFVHNFTK